MVAGPMLALAAMTAARRVQTWLGGLASQVGLASEALGASAVLLTVKIVAGALGPLGAAARASATAGRRTESRRVRGMGGMSYSLCILPLAHSRTIRLLIREGEAFVLC